MRLVSLDCYGLAELSDHQNFTPFAFALLLRYFDDLSDGDHLVIWPIDLDFPYGKSESVIIGAKNELIIFKSGILDPDMIYRCAFLETQALSNERVGAGNAPMPGCEDTRHILGREGGG